MSEYVSDCLSTSSNIGRAPRISCPIKAHSEHFALGVPQIISDCRKNLRIDTKISKMIGCAFPISNSSNGFRNFPIVSIIFHHFPLISINDCRGLRMSALHVSFPEVPLFLYVSFCFFIVALLLGTSASKHFNSNVFLGSPFISPSCRFISIYILLYPSIIFYHHSSSFIIFHHLLSIHFPVLFQCPTHVPFISSQLLPLHFRSLLLPIPCMALRFPALRRHSPPLCISFVLFCASPSFHVSFPYFPPKFLRILRCSASPHVSAHVPCTFPMFPLHIRFVTSHCPAKRCQQYPKRTVSFSLKAKSTDKREKMRKGMKRQPNCFPMFSYIFLKPYLIDVFPGGRPPSSDRHPTCRTMSADTFIDGFPQKSSHRTLHTLCVFWQSGAPGTTSEHASKPAGRAFGSTLSS